MEDENPTILFDRYYMEVFGGAQNENFQMFFYPDINSIDTLYKASLDIDTIPILVIDTFCFYVECIDSSFCEQAFMNSYIGMEKWKSGRLLYKPDLIGKDLYDKGDWLEPSSFKTLDLAIYVPLECDKVTVKFKAKLIDRVSKKMIQTEDKVLHLDVKRWKRVSIGS